MEKVKGSEYFTNALYFSLCKTVLIRFIAPLLYWASHWYFLFDFLLVSRNQENRVMVRFTKWRAKWRESFVCLAVCGVKVIKSFYFYLHRWHAGRNEVKTDLSFPVYVQLSVPVRGVTTGKTAFVLCLSLQCDSDGLALSPRQPLQEVTNRHPLPQWCLKGFDSVTMWLWLHSSTAFKDNNS